MLDQSAYTSGILDLCLKYGVSMIAAAPFDSGILATGPVPGARSAYQLATPAVMERVRKIESICAAHGTALQAAALQYPLQHAAVASVLAGMKSPGEVRQNVAWMQAALPPALWSALAADGGVEMP